MLFYESILCLFWIKRDHKVNVWFICDMIIKLSAFLLFSDLRGRQPEHSPRTPRPPSPGHQGAQDPQGYRESLHDAVQLRLVRKLHLRVRVVARLHRHDSVFARWGLLVEPIASRSPPPHSLEIFIDYRRESRRKVGESRGDIGGIK